ncbi:UNVERIFIED_CONTAM: hypothetical protein Sindi_1853100, partial [Sesamum indicum]
WPSCSTLRHPKLCPQSPYEIWHGKPALYKYLRVYGSPAYIKKLVGDKLASRSSLYRFVGYPKETAGYYFYDSSGQKIFVSRNTIFLEKGFRMNSQCDEELLEDSSEIPHQDNATPSVLTIPSNSALVLRRSTRISQRPDRYGLLCLTSTLD